MTAASRARLGPAAPLAALAACALLSACAQKPAAVGQDRAAHISDQVHGGGTPGFFWLPPIAPATTYGTFKPGLDPVVVVERLPLGSGAPIATFTTSSGPQDARVRSDGVSQYLVDWHTGRFDLQVGAQYRIRVSVEGLELGFVDVDVLGSGQGRQDVPRDQFFPLVNGRTLPIKFRIDVDAVRCLGVTCAPLDQCHLAGACDVHTGQCTNPAKADGTPCDDGSVCTTVDTCQSGTCTGPALACDDGEGCSFDGCDPVQGCVSIHQYGPTCDTPPPPDDVTIGDFWLAGGPFHANQHVWLSVELDAAADHPDYMMEFVLFPLGDDSQEVEGVLFGATLLEMVPAGHSQRWLEFPIPPDLAPGRYQLVAHQYPDGPFVESSSHPEYDIAAPEGLPVLDITGYAADSSALLVDPANTVTAPEVHLASPLGGTLEVVAWNQAAAQVPIKAWLEWGGQRVPLLLWDAQQGRYVSALAVALQADEPGAFSLEAALAEPEAERVRAGLPPQTPVQAKVVITVNEERSVLEGTCTPPPSGPSGCAHAVETPAVVFAAPAAASKMRAATLQATSNTQPLVYEKSYHKYSENKYLGAGVDFAARAELSQAGFDGNATAAIPIKIFDTRRDFANASAVAAAPLTSPATLAYDVKVLGKKVAGKTITGVSYTWPLDFGSVTEEVSYSWTIVVWCVPVTLALGARGVVDLKGNVTASSALAYQNVATLQMQVIPHGKLEGFGGAAVGVSWHGFGLAAGVVASLALVDTNFTATLGGRLDVLLEPPDRFLRGSLFENLTYTVSSGGGNVKLMVAFPNIKWCKKWFIKYPCGIKYSTKTKTLFTWPGYVLGPFKLLDKSQEGFEIALPPCATCASAGAECGPVPDICGGTLDCGACPGGFTCSDGACVPCWPASCSDVEAQCGPVQTSCGTTLDCGGCEPGTGCVENQCVTCSPATCNDVEAQCGPVQTSCGTTLDCGTCSPGYRCSQNSCVPDCTPATCASMGWDCGSGPNGCGGTLSCGGCGAGEACSGHACVPGGLACDPPCRSGQVCCEAYTPISYCVTPPQVCR